MVKISKGNTKLGNVMNLSLTPCKTCPADAPCRDKCYAMKAYRQYPNVREAWNGNTEATNNRPAFFSEVNKSVNKKKPEYFRWQVAGDILDQNYLDGMKMVARANPKTKFLAFTKNHGLDFGSLPKNLQIVASLWSNWGKRPVGLPVAWMQDGKENRVTGNEIECPGKCKDCKACWNLNSLGKDVVFKAH
jgi:hypothetical protein